ncbi:MAG: hypothetical protein JO360_02910 [Acidobacteria bacterium]|nr:hypothetical protein [Acidobacteriota bacterium]
MSYHILHQFDEQWFADNGSSQSPAPSRLFGSLSDGSDRREAERRSASTRCWLFILASLLVASCALYYALDARRHADDLQRRLSEMETRLKK